MSVAKRVVLFAIAGVIVGMPLDALHVKTHVLAYKHPSLGLQAWWTPLLFAMAGILLCESHHLLSRFIGTEKQFSVSPKQLALSLLVLVAVYGSSGFLKSTPYVAAVTYFLVFSVTARYLWLESKKLLAIYAISVALIGTLIESLITLTGQFHYLHSELWRVPIWLPFIYMNSIFITSNFDNFIGSYRQNRS